MEFFMVQFDDDYLDVVSKKDVKNISKNKASVRWKPNKTYYAARILKKGTNKNSLMELLKLKKKQNAKKNCTAEINKDLMKSNKREKKKRNIPLETFNIKENKSTKNSFENNVNQSLSGYSENEPLNTSNIKTNEGSVGNTLKNFTKNYSEEKNEDNNVLQILDVNIQNTKINENIYIQHCDYTYSAENTSAYSQSILQNNVERNEYKQQTSEHLTFGNNLHRKITVSNLETVINDLETDIRNYDLESNRKIEEESSSLNLKKYDHNLKNSLDTPNGVEYPLQNVEITDPQPSFNGVQSHCDYNYIYCADNTSGYLQSILHNNVEIDKYKQQTSEHLNVGNTLHRNISVSNLETVINDFEIDTRNCDLESDRKTEEESSSLVFKNLKNALDTPNGVEYPLQNVEITDPQPSFNGVQSHCDYNYIYRAENTSGYLQSILHNNVEIDKYKQQTSEHLNVGNTLHRNISVSNLETVINDFEIDTRNCDLEYDRKTEEESSSLVFKNLKNALDTPNGVQYTLQNVEITDPQPSFNGVHSIEISDFREKVNIISDIIIKPSKITKYKQYASKNQYCWFCTKPIKRFWRHLTLVHKSEDEVKVIINLEKKSKERKHHIDVLRKKGNYLFNHNNLSEQIVSRRAVNKSQPTEYTDCPKCLVRLSKNTLRRHYKNCDPEGSKINKRKTVALSRQVTLTIHKIADPILKQHIFPTLRNDAVTNILRQDYLAILYGNKLVKMHTSTHHYKMIRAHLRYVGKFLIEIKKINRNITDFESCFVTTEYDNCTKAIKSVAKFNEDEGQFAAPNSAFTLGTILKFCASILETDCIKKGDEQKRIRVDNFLKLLQRELTTDINKTAIENQKTIRRQQKVTLPLTSDLQKMLHYIQVERQKCLDIINQEFTIDRWKRLAGYTLVGILVYNGRRPGEIERLTIEDFKLSCQSLKEIQGYDKNDLDHISQGYERCTLRGKKGRNVSIVLHTLEIICMNTILHYKNEAQIDPKNPYVFGLPGVKPFKYLSSALLLKKYANLAELEYPERMFATNIRKNLATKSTDLDLKTDEREHIMNFMGHSETVHKNIYRQPDPKKDILVMPKILNFVTGKSDLKGEHLEIGKLNLDSEDINIDHSEINFTNHKLLSRKLSFSDSDDENDPNYLPSISDEYDKEEATKTRKNSKLIDISLGYVPRKSWTTEERQAARLYFNQCITKAESPSLDKCKEIVRECKVLSGRTPNQLKAWIVNQINQSKSRPLKTTKITRKTWSTPEKKICKKEFGEEVAKGIYPSGKKLERVLLTYPELSGRNKEMLIGHLQHSIKKYKEKVNLNVSDIS